MSAPTGPFADPRARGSTAITAPPLPGQVHVWRLDADRVGGAHIAAARALLGADERTRCDRLAVDTADMFILTRAALRRVLGGCIGIAPRALRFEYGATGKPRVAEAAAADLSFSVTHTGRISLIAVAALPRVGVDAERVLPRARARSVAHRVFAPRTGALLDRLTGEEQVRAFYHAWTLREAHVKALGTGVLLSADTLPLDWPLDLAPAQREEPVGDGPPRVWTVVPLEPAPGYVATLVAEGSAAAPRAFDAAALLTGD